MPGHCLESSQCFRMVHEGLIERFCQRSVSDICENPVRHRLGNEIGTRTVVRRTNPAACYDKIVAFNHAAASFYANNGNNKYIVKSIGS